MNHLEYMPVGVLTQILSNLTYAEIVKLRLVNKWFNEVCTRILNRKFLSLKAALDNLILNLTSEIDRLSKDDDYDIQHISYVCSCYKIFNILKSEFQVLYAVCGRYVKLGKYCFSGGIALDYFKKAMNIPFKFVCQIDRPLQAYAGITMRLFLLNEEFMDHFESVIEPIILEQHSVTICYGTKLVDLLDSYIYSNYHIEATFNGNTCQICSRYEILDTHSVSPPVKIPKSVASAADMTNLLRYFRNEVRWNNYIYTLDSAYTSCLINNKSERKSGRFCLNVNDEIEIIDNWKASSYENEAHSDTIFDKTFKRRVGNPSENENVSYYVELQCSKYCTPMRLEPYILEASRSKDSKINVIENHSFSEMIRHISLYYEFSMGVKVIRASPQETLWNTSIENSLNLYTDGDVCVVFQSTKEVPTTLNL